MCRKRFSAWGLIAVTMLVCLLPMGVSAHDGTTHQATENSEAINRALNWLEGVQRDDGAIVTVNDAATDFQATAEALSASSLVGGSALNRSATLEFLNSDPATLTTEQLARLVIALQDTDQSSTQAYQALINRQGDDGGFGDFSGYDSNPLDTAYALLALQRIERDAAVAGRALSYLSSAQLSTGGFGFYGEQSSTMVTALVIKALKPYVYTFNISAVLSRATAFLYTTKDDRQGWDSDWESALALQALIPVTTDVSRYRESVGALESKQLATGSWESQVYSTALAISTLDLLANLEVPADPEKAVVRGRIIDKSGGSAISNAFVDVRDFDAEAVSIEDSGHFAISNLEPGNYSVVYSAPGYLSASQNLTLQKGQFADVGTIALSVAPTATLISGVVTDLSTGYPVMGAVVAVTVNGTTASAISNENGEYHLLSELGDAALAVSSEGYHTISAAVALSAGTAVSFSPGLTPLPEEQPALSSISGWVVDQNDQPLAGAAVSLGEGDAVLTTADGRFMVENLSAGDVRVQIAKEGYEALSSKLIIPERTRVNLGAITLSEKLDLPSTSISGQVLNMSTGSPVAGASVAVGSISATTDSNGFYSLNDISLLEFTVQVNASGYIFTNKDISLTEHSQLALNITIRKADLGGIEIAAVSSNATSYGAYEPVLITASLENNTALTLGARLYVKVKNSTGDKIAGFPASYLPPLESALDEEELAHYQKHLAESVEQLAPGEQRELPLEQWWNTQNTAPGDYVVTVQAVDAATGNLVSEKSLVITLEETRKVAALRLSANPGYVLLNREAELVMSAEVLNRSNVSSALRFDYRLLSPDGKVLTEEQANISLSPVQNNLMVELGSLLHRFSTSGDYLLEISNVSGATVVESSTGAVFVPPSIRLDIQQSLTPYEVVPQEGVGVTSNIQIKGVDGE